MKWPEPLPLWLVIAGLGITQIVGWGTVFFIIGTLSPDIAASTGWSQTLIFGAFTAALLVGAIVARPAGRLIDKYGGRRLVPLGSFLLALGCAITGFFPTKAGYLGGWLVIGAAMRLATYDPVFASLAQISKEKARRSISALTLMGGLSSTIFWPLNHYLSQHIGWANTFLVHSAAHLFLCLPIHIVLLREARPTSGSDHPADSRHVPLLGRQRLLAITLFATALSINGLIYSALSAHIMPLFRGLGLTAGQAVAISSVIGPAQVASRLGEMLLGRNLPVTAVSSISFGLVPVSFALMLAGGFSLPASLAFAGFYGASNGVITIMRGTVPLALFGREGYAEVLGVIGAPSLILSAIAPLLFAWTLNLVSAPAAFALLGLAALISSLSMFALHRLHPR